MPRRNLFFSYHHRSCYQYLKQLRELLADPNIYDYGFKEDDLSEESKYHISKKIQYRIWTSSVTVVLVGDETASSLWVDWEVWYSLQKFNDAKVKRRSFKPKGLLVVYLPVAQHTMPSRLQENIQSGYAVQIGWSEIPELFYKKVDEAYVNRAKTYLIRNEKPPNINPRKFLFLHLLNGKIRGWFFQ